MEGGGRSVVDWAVLLVVKLSTSFRMGRSCGEGGWVLKRTAEWDGAVVVGVEDDRGGEVWWGLVDCAGEEEEDERMRILRLWECDSY